MRTFSAFVCLQISFLIGKGQVDIEKYSYLINSAKLSTNIMAGTGFFVEYKTAYYLVSCWHVFSGLNPNTLKFEDDRFAAEEIMVGRKSGNRMLGLKLKLYDSLKNEIFLQKKIDDTSYLDVSAIKIDKYLSDKLDVISIKDSDTATTWHNGDSIVFYGYPIIDNNQSNTTIKFSGVALSNKDDNKDVIFKSDIYEGCSGSPLFVIKEKSKHLIGVVYAEYNEPGITRFCKAIAIKELIELLSNNK